MHVIPIPFLTSQPDRHFFAHHDATLVALISRKPDQISYQKHIDINILISNNFVGTGFALTAGNPILNSYAGKVRTKGGQSRISGDSGDDLFQV
ncbi:MAG: hypothetical protein Q7V04_13230 [Deltaproteobacteria bacterium]|nr:hypothetical protein [Deltaproteobacteria bacterium]